MKKRIFSFDGSDGATEMLVLILKHYADIAYPLGGSDCAAASREAIHGITNKLIQSDEAEINRRQRPLLKSAVKWFYTESEYASPEDPMYDNLLEKLSEK